MTLSGYIHHGVSISSWELDLMTRRFTSVRDFCFFIGPKELMLSWNTSTFPLLSAEPLISSTSFYRVANYRHYLEGQYVVLFRKCC